MIELSKGRSNLYGLLALIYEKEIALELLHKLKEPTFINTLSDLGFLLANDFQEKPDEELIEDLAVEYARLFLGPAQYISPHESVHHERADGDWGSFWGAATVEVKSFIESSGLKFDEKFQGIPDHISVELEFMRHVTEREKEAWEAEDQERALYCLKMEKMFLKNHLSKWVDSFCDKVIDKADLSFYREIAKVTKSFIAYETENLDDYLADAKKIGCAA